MSGQAPGTVVELGHVVLYVRDLEASRAFYRDVLGWPVAAEVNLGGTRAAAFSAGRTHHELLLIEVGPNAASLPPGRRVGMYHFGVKVGDTDDELRAALERLKDSGVPGGVESEPVTPFAGSSATSTARSGTPTMPWCGRSPSW